MSDTDLINKEFPSISVEVEKGQLLFFAKATGETNPIYTDENAAKQAGYRSLPAPPTYTFTLALSDLDMVSKYEAMELDLANLLHGEQAFEYFAPVCAGDVITLQPRVTDVFYKNGGALKFVVEETTATNQHDELVVKSKQTYIVRIPAVTNGDAANGG